MGKERETPDPTGEVYRISELVESSGVSRDMIKYYLRAGLLPPAHKPRPNLSHYTADHLRLIALIRKFQEQTRLSLPQIAQLFAGKAFDPNQIEIELLSAGHGDSDDNTIIPLHREKPSEAGISLPAEFIDTLKNLSLLDQDDSGNREQVAGLLWAAHEAGVPLSFFETAQARIAELADLEVKALIRIKRPDLNFDDTMEYMKDVDHIINRWIVAEKNRQIRGEFQRVQDNSERAIASLLDNIYRPSSLFLERHQADAALAELLKHHANLPTAAEPMLSLYTATFSLGAYEETIELACAATDAGTDKDLATAILALSHCILGDIETAYQFACQLEECPDNHPIILQARITSMLMNTSRFGGVADTNIMLKNAGQLFLQLRLDASAADPEAVLLLARANAAFPDFANSRETAIHALEDLEQRLENGSAALPKLDIPALEESLQQVYRIYVLYYLGVLHDMGGNRSEARRYLEQVVQIDPASNFGITAYRRLSSWEISKHEEEYNGEAE
ncbi:MAG: MerR family transcriptional regulator [Halioglobus sp.]